jgi:hypothetical protein
MSNAKSIFKSKRGDPNNDHLLARIVSLFVWVKLYYNLNPEADNQIVHSKWTETLGNMAVKTQYPLSDIHIGDLITKYFDRIRGKSDDTNKQILSSMGLIMTDAA